MAKNDVHEAGYTEIILTPFRGHTIYCLALTDFDLINPPITKPGHQHFSTIFENNQHAIKSLLFFACVLGPRPSWGCCSRRRSRGYGDGPSSVFVAKRPPMGSYAR
jgi:hypothetical protein